MMVRLRIISLLTDQESTEKQFRSQKICIRRCLFTSLRNKISTSVPEHQPKAVTLLQRSSASHLLLWRFEAPTDSTLTAHGY